MNEYTVYSNMMQRRKINDETVINEKWRNSDDTGGFVTDEFAWFDVAEAREQRSNVVLWHGLRQVIDDKVRTHLVAVLLLLLLLLMLVGGRSGRRRWRRRWWWRTVNGRRRAVDTTATAAAQMRLEGDGRLLRLRHGRRALRWRLWRWCTLHVHVHSAGTVDSPAFSAVAGNLTVSNKWQNLL